MEFHIQCDPKDIAPYVFVPGDPGRAKKIAEHFDEYRFVTDTRGYYVYTGTVDGIPVTSCSTGMGGPQVAIGVEELAHMGAHTFLRVGSCGTLQDGIQPGDVIIASGAVRGGATGNRYLPPAFPAAPDFGMLTALVEAAGRLGIPVHTGLAWSTDVFYAESDPAFTEQARAAGVKAIEMEADTLFVVSSFRGWRSGALFACDGTSTEIKPDWGRDAYLQGEENEIRIAIEAMKSIAITDHGKAQG